MYLIDSHCHLDFDQFDADRELVLAHCQQLGVEQIIVPAVAADGWEGLLNICQQSEMLYPALGLHPMLMQQHHSEHLRQLTELIAHNHLVAIGEIGLDFYLADHDKSAQIALFNQQLIIAQHAELAVILHVRKAHDQTISLLKKTPVIGGIVHAFNGSLQQAKHYTELGFVFGVGGAITHPRATRLRQLVAELPLSSLVLETDSPDMPLAGMQTQRNTPENIPAILTALAEIRSETAQDLAIATSKNCKRLFPLLN